jgi:Cation transporter/ATPase, N-terminus
VWGQARTKRMAEHHEVPLNGVSVTKQAPAAAGEYTCEEVRLVDRRARASRGAEQEDAFSVLRAIALAFRPLTLAALSTTPTQHLLSIPEVAAKLGTSLDGEAPNKSRGLTEVEAKERLAKYGPNQLSPPKQRPLWLQFLLKVRAHSGAAARDWVPQPLATGYKGSGQKPHASPKSCFVPENSTKRTR